MSGLRALTVAATCSVTVAACGSSGGPAGSTSATRALVNRGLAFARMRAHGVGNFPDPSGGHLTFNGSASSPVFGSAQTAIATLPSSSACEHLAPQKVPASSGHESPRQLARDDAKLLRWANCMRRHGYASLPDPKIGTAHPEPGVGTVLGQGGAYLAIPISIDAHSPTFLQTAQTCGINPTGR